MVNYQTEIYDLGDNYASNVFTAPVDGVYHFDATIRFNNVSNRVFIGLLINGSPGDTPNYRGNDLSSSALYQLVMSMDLKLEEGDTVRVEAYSVGATVDTDATFANSYFSGHLISRVNG